MTIKKDIVLKAGEQPHSAILNFTLKNNKGHGLNTTKEALSLAYYSDKATTIVADPKVTSETLEYNISTGIGSAKISTIKAASVPGSYWGRLIDSTHDLSKLPTFALIIEEEEETDELDISKSSFSYADGTLTKTLYVER